MIKVPKASSYDKLRIKKAEVLSRKLNLSPNHMQSVLLENPSRAVAYHNSQHCITVALYAYEMAVAHRLSLTSHQLLFLSALYHDWDHTASSGDDAANIERALKHASCLNKKTDSTLSQNKIRRIIRLIKSTHFPHPNPKNIEEKILQDADLLQYNEPDANKFIEGLAVETGHKISKETTKVFLANQHFNTEWAIQKIKKITL